MNTIKTLLILVALSFLNVQAQELKSPNGKFVMHFALLNDGTPAYQLNYLNKEIIIRVTKRFSIPFK